MREQFKLRIIESKEPWNKVTRLAAVRGTEAWKLMEVDHKWASWIEMNTKLESTSPVIQPLIVFDDGTVVTDGYAAASRLSIIAPDWFASHEWMLDDPLSRQVDGPSGRPRVDMPGLP